MFFKTYSLGLLNLLKGDSSYGIGTAATGILAWPVPAKMQASYLYGYTKAYDGFHNGIDISIEDADIIAAADGTVITSQFNAGGYGNYVIIDHGNGLATLYAHMNHSSVYKENDKVKKGDVIGTTGTTGNSNGKHLHFEVRKDSNNDGTFDGKSETVDPLEYYNVEPNKNALPLGPGVSKEWTIPYDEFLSDSNYRMQLYVQDPYNITGPKGLGGTQELITMLHSWEGGGTPEEVNGVLCYKIHDDGYGNLTVGRGVDIINSGFKEEFIKNGYIIKEGEYVPVEFVDKLESRELEEKRQSVLTKTSGIQLLPHQEEALVSRAYNCGVSGATGQRNGLNFVEAYKKYWVGNETTEIDYNHPFYVNYMSKPNTASGQYSLGLERRRRAEWIYFVTGTPANNGDLRIGI